MRTIVYIAAATVIAGCTITINEPCPCDGTGGGSASASSTGPEHCDPPGVLGDGDACDVDCDCCQADCVAHVCQAPCFAGMP